MAVRQSHNLDNTVRARGDRGRDLETLIVEVKKLFSYCAPDCRKYLVVVPDAAQVNDFYLHNMEQLGARFARAEDLHQADYPFLARLRQGLAGEPIAILNPLPRLQAEEARGRRLYYANDTHLNRTGQALLGQYVLERLQADGLASR